MKYTISNSNTLVIAFSLLGLCVSDVIVNTYERRIAQKIANSYQQITVLSAMKCSIECGKDVKCLAYSYHATDRLCSLNDAIVSFSNAAGWTAYTNILSDLCDVGWVLYNEWCYKVIEEATWLDAENTCHGYGAHLVKIESEAEYNFTVDSVVGSGKFWIGLNDRADEGSYVWVSDTSPLSYSKWGSGQPDGALKLEEDCIAKGVDFWHDYSCDTVFPAVCEKHL